MTSAEAFAIMKERLKPWATIDERQVLFVPDDSLDYRLGQSVIGRRDTAFGLTDSERWASYLDGDHSWLHANLLFTAEKTPIISLRRGPNVTKEGKWEGALPISINVSMERARLEWA